jgi:hypothetical protein
MFLWWNLGFPVVNVRATWSQWRCRDAATGLYSGMDNFVKYLRDTFKKQAWLKDANSSGMVSVRADASLKIAE